ncbi:MAG: tachylectin-related carbohydrate-binding protein [Planctomycetota bacterium]
MKQKLRLPFLLTGMVYLVMTYFALLSSGNASVRSIILAVKKDPGQQFGQMYWYMQEGSSNRENYIKSGGKVDNGPTGILANAGNGMLFAIDSADDLVTHRIELENDSTLTVHPPEQYVQRGFGRHGYTQLFSSGRGALFAKDKKGDIYYYPYTMRRSSVGYTATIAAERVNVANGWNSFKTICHLADDKIFVSYPNGDAYYYPYHLDRDSGIKLATSKKLSNPFQDDYVFRGVGEEIFSVNGSGLKRRDSFRVFPKDFLKSDGQPSMGWDFSQLLTIDPAYVGIKNQSYRV